MNNDELHNKLLNIFMIRFNLDESQAIAATIQTVESWDSFTHMDLMLELEGEFKLTQLSGDEFATLVSFKKIFNYIKLNKSE